MQCGEHLARRSSIRVLTNWPKKAEALMGATEDPGPIAQNLMTLAKLQAVEEQHLKGQGKRTLKCKMLCSGCTTNSLVLSEIALPLQR